VPGAVNGNGNGNGTPAADSEAEALVQAITEQILARSARQ